MTASAPEEFKWFYSFDKELYDGPYNSKEEAIAEAIEGHYGDEKQVHLMEATKDEFRIELPDYWWEWLDDVNSDKTDPDGEGLSALLPDSATEQLTAAINEVIEKWKTQVNLPVPWSFGKTRNREWVPLLSTSE